MKFNYIYKEETTTFENNNKNGMWYTTISL